MKKLLFCLCIIVFSTILFAHAFDYFEEPSGKLPEIKKFIVNGDKDKYYPVIFNDVLWIEGFPTKLEIGRGWVHADSKPDLSWVGSLVSKFIFHVNKTRNGSSFIDSFIRTKGRTMVAKYDDLSRYNESRNICIWLRGGEVTYYYRYLNYFGDAPEPIIADNSPGHHILPYIQKANKGVLHHDYICEAETAVSPTITNQGFNFADDSHFNHIQAKEILAKDVTVSPSAWADDVFNKNYKMMNLHTLDNYISKNKHLPGMYTEKEVKEKGVSIGNIEEKLVRKVEELTKYIIKQNEKIEHLEKEVNTLKE